MVSSSATASSSSTSSEGSSNRSSIPRAFLRLHLRLVERLFHRLCNFQEEVTLYLLIVRVFPFENILSVVPRTLNRYSHRELENGAIDAKDSSKALRNFSTGVVPVHVRQESDDCNLDLLIVLDGLQLVPQIVKCIP